MKMNIELSEEAESRIRSQAELQGQDVSDYVVELIERWLSRQEELEGRGESSLGSE